MGSSITMQHQDTTPIGQYWYSFTCIVYGSTQYHSSVMVSPDLRNEWQTVPAADHYFRWVEQWLCHLLGRWTPNKPFKTNISGNGFDLHTTIDLNVCNYCTGSISYQWPQHTTWDHPFCSCSEVKSIPQDTLTCDPLWAEHFHFTRVSHKFEAFLGTDGETLHNRWSMCSKGGCVPCLIGWCGLLLRHLGMHWAKHVCTVHTRWERLRRNLFMCF